MKRPEINGWEVTTNENGIKMATLPRDTMEEILKFVEYADKQLRLGAVSNSVAAEYAEFCVRCDREKLPLLCLEDYIKQYCC